MTRTDVARRVPVPALGMLLVLALVAAALVVARPAPAKAAAEEAFCTGEGLMVLYPRSGSGPPISARMRTCVIRVPGPVGDAPARSARIVVWGIAGSRIKASLTITLHNYYTGRGMRGRGGTWSVNHPTIQVTTSADRSGVCTYAQGYVSSVYATYNGRGYSGGGLFQSTRSQQGCR
jgi:hypothetical protein